jgi:hypothetical protein
MIICLLNNRVYIEKYQSHFVSSSYFPSVFVHTNSTIDCPTLKDIYGFYKIDIKFFWLYKSRSTLDFLVAQKLGGEGLEPSANWLKASCSTPELSTQIVKNQF